MSRQLNRMTPSSFEGYTVRRLVTRGKRGRSFVYVAGYLTRMKQRNSDHFVSMGEASGAPGAPKRGLAMLGAVWFPTNRLTLGAINYRTHDVLNIFYTELDYGWSAGEIQLRFGAQLTDQRSTGDDLLNGESFDTRVWGAKIAASLRRVILTAAFSTTSREARIRSPFGSYPGYLSYMLADFDRAGEDAWGVSAGYTFRRVSGLSGFVRFASGSGARDEDTRSSLPDQREIDLTLDYKPEDGKFQGFWIRVRGAFLDRSGAGSSNNIRIILNYDLPVL